MDIVDMEVMNINTIIMVDLPGIVIQVLTGQALKLTGSIREKKGISSSPSTHFPPLILKRNWVVEFIYPILKCPLAASRGVDASKKYFY